MKIVVTLRSKLGEVLTPDSPLIVRDNGGRLVPMTGAFLTRMDKFYAPKLGWHGATIRSCRQGFATAAVRCNIQPIPVALAVEAVLMHLYQYPT